MLFFVSLGVIMAAVDFLFEEETPIRDLKSCLGRPTLESNFRILREVIF